MTSEFFWKRFKQNRIAVLSLVILCFISLLALFAPWVTLYTYEEQNIVEQLQSPSFRHWFGTDTLGRDLYSRVIYGARTSLTIGIITAYFAFVVGTTMGAVAGFRGGWVDWIITKIVDLFYIFPPTLLAILIMVYLGRGLHGIFLAIGITTWVTQARLVRAQVQQAKELPYVEAAIAAGASQWKIIFKHILPNLWGPILVSVTFQIPTNIMSESFLSFIGLGIQPPLSSWGTLANEGFRAMQSYPHLILFPGGVLFVTLLAFNYLGDGIRDALDTVSERRLE